VARYIIRLKAEGDQRSSTRKINGAKRSFVITDLRADTLYFLRLVAVSCRGKSPPSKWARAHTGSRATRSSEEDTIRDETRVPGMPKALRTRTLTNSIILTWEPPQDNVLVRGFVVGHGEGVPDVKWQYVEASTRTFTINNLRPATQYVISLRAFNNFGKGPVVYDIIYTREEEGPTAGPLQAPIGLRSKVLSPSTVWLEWIDPSLGRAQKVTDNRYYIVNYKPVPYGSEITTTVKALNVVLYDLIPATTYEFKVKTIKEEDSTVYGISVYNTTYDAPPGTAPTDFAVTPDEDDPTTVYVSWMPPVQPNGAIAGYLVMVSPDPDLEDRRWTADNIMGDRLSTTIRSLVPHTTYYFKIQARNLRGYGPVSSVVSYTPYPTGASTTRHPLAGLLVFTTQPDPDRMTTISSAPPQQPAAMTQNAENQEVDEVVTIQTSSASSSSVVPKKTPNGLLPMDSQSVIFSSEVQHTVTAVITWTEASPSCSDGTSEIQQTTYQVQYYPENKPELRVGLNTTKNVVLLHGLQPDTRYRYEVTAYRPEENQPSWTATDILDTHYK